MAQSVSAGSLYLQGRWFKSIPEDQFIENIYDGFHNFWGISTIYDKKETMNLNNYVKQQKRAWSRKLELVEMMGGKCCCCGYDKNIAALEFHHTNPKEKGFQLDSRHLSNTSMERIMEESKKCILLCSNCHKEVHYPGQTKTILQEMAYDNKPLSSDKFKTVECPVCGKRYRYVKGKKYCSQECRKKDKGYPPKEEVAAKYQELKSQHKVAEYYGLTRKIIINILKEQ